MEKRERDAAMVVWFNGGFSEEIERKDILDFVPL